MLNYVLAPLGILLIGLGAAGLFLAFRPARRAKGPQHDDEQAIGPEDSD